MLLLHNVRFWQFFSPYLIKIRYPKYKLSLCWIWNRMKYYLYLCDGGRNNSVTHLYKKMVKLAKSNIVPGKRHYYIPVCVYLFVYMYTLKRVLAKIKHQDNWRTQSVKIRFTYSSLMTLSKFIIWWQNNRLNTIKML